MRSQNKEHVAGIFQDRGNLDALLMTLADLDYNPDEVSIVVSDRTRKQYSPVEGTHADEGAEVGAIVGGLLGALIGGLTFVPLAGVFIAGPLLAWLAGGAIGATAGGLAGALIGVGIPEAAAKEYEQALQQPGNILAIAHVRSQDVPEVRVLFERFGADQIKVHQ